MMLPVGRRSLFSKCWNQMGRCWFSQVPEQRFRIMFIVWMQGAGLSGLKSYGPTERDLTAIGEETDGMLSDGGVWERWRLCAADDEL